MYSKLLLDHEQFSHHFLFLEKLKRVVQQHIRPVRIFHEHQIKNNDQNLHQMLRQSLRILINYYITRSCAGFQVRVGFGIPLGNV